MKLTVIGGGGVRSLFLAKSIALEARELNIDELVLMDTNDQKLEIFGSLAMEAAIRLAPHLKVSLTRPCWRSGRWRARRTLPCI
ncbi:MAG TPA: hypothetical protein PLD39_10010, partial [Flexilinea sp.]|nr:hypothetical protein [Flexilinea sp.]